MEQVIRLKFFKGPSKEYKPSIQPASFQSRSDRTFLQTEYIVHLLKRGIDEQRILTREDIIDCYVSFYFHGKEKLVRREWNYFERKEVENTYTPEEFRAKLYAPSVIQWFKNNLGAAILKGRILAIPLIDIESDTMSNSEQSVQGSDTTTSK